MKRILSVILSLALLASVLIIPMSVNAGNSVLDADTAFENLNAAVDGLVTDWDNVTPSAFANPIYSISKYADSAADRTRTADAKYVEIADSTDSKLGPKTFKIKQSLETGPIKFFQEINNNRLISFFGFNLNVLLENATVGVTVMGTETHCE